MRIPVDVSGWRLVATEGARPVFEYVDGQPTDRQRGDRDGVPLFEVALSVAEEGRKARQIFVRVAGEPEGLDPEVPVRVTVEGLEANTWERRDERGMSAGVSFTATRIVPWTRPGRAPAGGGAGGGGGA